MVRVAMLHAAALLLRPAVPACFAPKQQMWGLTPCAGMFLLRIPAPASCKLQPPWPLGESPVQSAALRRLAGPSVLLRAHGFIREEPAPSASIGKGDGTEESGQQQNSCTRVPCARKDVVSGQ